MEELHDLLGWPFRSFSERKARKDALKHYYSLHNYYSTKRKRRVGTHLTANTGFEREHHYLEAIMLSAEPILTGLILQVL